MGSSSRRTEGLMSSSWPMLTRLRSPPLMPFLKKPPAAIILRTIIIRRHSQTTELCVE